MQSEAKETPVFRGDGTDKFSVHEWEDLMDTYLRKRGIPMLEHHHEILSRLMDKAKDIVRITLRSNTSLRPSENPKVIFDILKQHFIEAVDVAEEALTRLRRQMDNLCQEAAMMFVKHYADPTLSAIFRLKAPDKWTAGSHHAHEVLTDAMWKRVLLDQDQFCCVVCLDLLKEPVTTACGHSYCKSCIESCWDQDDLKGIYNCPQCRQTFTPRPTLRKNNMLAEVVDKLKKTGLQAASPDLCSAGPGDVVCDFCTGTRKQKALMSCLVCLASYCESHLQPHYESPAFKKHKLIKATTQLQEKICSHHDKLLEVFCRTDQQCICLLCVMDEHKGHDTVSAAAERTEKQKQLGFSQLEIQQKVLEREKELKELQQAVESIKVSFIDKRMRWFQISPAFRQK
ncbi:hypothetical protein DPEC_G00219480 [Dallia pectoralis]|uniref:Uncharacterized protein n=1 Tax=Dallia pectoralis TaxID=75939 RepID=A0ACC2G2Z7_DALPE|nr:hypothetical protein DPEC_G00219480 [Dallia pectoralis]